MHSSKLQGCLATAAAALAITGAAGCSDSTGPRQEGRSSPETVRIVTEDIPRFWIAFDRMTASTDTIPLRVDYLDPGTAGLKDFTNARWKNARTLASMVWPVRAYYASIRQNTLGVAALEPDIRRVMRNLDGLYDGAVFPDVYFAIGGMSTGGTTSDRGLLIGTELFARAPDSPLSVLSPWGQSVVRTTDILPAIVAHELTHYQQRFSGNGATTLLGRSIREGSADFVGELLEGRTTSESRMLFGDAHESEIWNDFKTEMHGADISRWLYNGGSFTSGSARPADLGYYVGYKITAAYYARQSDKRRALREILNISDVAEFLRASGYGEGL